MCSSQTVKNISFVLSVSWCLLKEKIQGLEAQESTPHAIKDNEDFLDRSPKRLMLGRLKGKKEKWQHVTTLRRVPRIQEQQTEGSNHIQALCGATAEEKAEVRTSEGKKQRSQKPREQEIQSPRDWGSKTMISRRKRKVVLIGDSLLLGTDAPNGCLDLGSWEV